MPKQAKKQSDADSGATSQVSPTVDGITAEEVLGMMVRLQEGGGAPPAIICMSVEARAELRELGARRVQMYRDLEATLLRARQDGNPLALFVES